MIIKNCKIITWGKPNQILEDKALFIDHEIIKDISDTEKLIKTHVDETIVDAQGQYIFPGNICAHTHFYGAFSRGLYIPGPSPKNFPEILNKLWWPLDRSLNGDAIKYSALVCLIDAIKHGTTALFDHHASQNHIQYSLDLIDGAVEMAGVRAALCYEFTDRDGKKKAIEGAEENIRYIQKLATQKTHKKAALFGMHASLTVSKESMELARKMLPEDIGIHLHVAEHSIDEYDSIEKYQVRIIDRLKNHQFLGKNSIIVHTVHIDAKEIELLAESNTWVTHQPRSNMNNAVGMAEVESMDRCGIKVCLGNDGFSNAMWEEWKAAYLSHKLWHRDPQRMNANLVKKIAADNNADLASRFFNTRVGRIEVGSQADLIFVDYHPYTEFTVENLPWHIIFGFNESMITSTMVAGEFIMKDRKLITLDEEAITKEAHKISETVWKNYTNLRNAE